MHVQVFTVIKLEMWKHKHLRVTGSCLDLTDCGLPTFKSHFWNSQQHCVIYTRHLSESTFSKWKEPQSPLLFLEVSMSTVGTAPPPPPCSPLTRAANESLPLRDLKVSIRSTSARCMQWSAVWRQRWEQMLDHEQKERGLGGKREV